MKKETVPAGVLPVLFKMGPNASLLKSFHSKN